MVLELTPKSRPGNCGLMPKGKRINWRKKRLIPTRKRITASRANATRRRMKPA